MFLWLQTHTASPSTQKVSLSSLRLEPTVQGTVIVLRPCKARGDNYVALNIMLLTCYNNGRCFGFVLVKSEDLDIVEGI
jgi:hypothetical protein